MIHITESMMHFNIPDNKFIYDKVFKAFSYLGNIKKERYISPSGCNAISDSKTLSIKKAFSESIERKTLMAGGTTNEEGYVQTFELISGKPSKLDAKYTTYRTQSPHIIDTTGMAAHYCSNEALLKAFEELLEKNTLFLFWYGKEGVKLDESIYHDHILYKRILNEGYCISAFVNNSFAPLISIIIIISNRNHIISSGISASLSFHKAFNDAINEAYLLKWQNQALDMVVNSNHSFDAEYHDKCIEHLNSFHIVNELMTHDSDQLTLQEYLNCIPAWVTNLHVFFLKNTSYPKLSVIKVFSTDLYNHLPQKNLLDIEQKINQKTIKLSKNQLGVIPDCIIK
jgi:hypothetical protein